MNPFRSLKACLCSAVIVTCLTAAAFADHRHSGGTSHHHHGYSRGSSSFRFSYGGFGYGYPSYGYGYGYGGYPYGHGGFGPSIGLRIYSTPRYYSTPNYVYPSYAAPVYSAPSTVIMNSPPSIPAPTFDNGPITIVAPASNSKPVEYTLNGQSFTMKPGQSQRFQHDRDWIVTFDRGPGKGTGKYSLKPSVYKFKPTDNGWELFEAAHPEPPTDAASSEPPKPIELVQPLEETVKPKAIPKAPAPAPDKAEDDAK